MDIQSVGSPIDVAVSGLRAQSLRLKVIAANIANVNTTRTEDGEPYRRRSVVLRTKPDGLNGVTVVEVAADRSADFRTVLQPGHPDADENGYVRMPNVDLPVEMMDLVVATRAYQANVAVMKRYQDMVETTVELLR
jgi:flagellar basal-body rod protein FlgC